MHAGMMGHSFTTNSVIQGYHVYGMHALIDEVFYCEQEIGNHSNPCAVVVKRATLRGTSLV